MTTEDKEKTPVAEVVEKPEDINPAPETTPDPVAKPEESNDDLRSVVDGLVETVTGLKETVDGLIAVGGETVADTAPVRKPWTHWGSK